MEAGSSTRGNKMTEIDAMTDTELCAFVSKAEADTAQAAKLYEDGGWQDDAREWHAACFAALYLSVTEMNRRGLQQARGPMQ